MSILGAGSLPAMGLAGSAAAGQQRAADMVDRDKADLAVQKMKADQARLANRELDDSIETDFSHGQVSDRDSDGRLPWQRPPEGGAGEEPAEKERQKPRAADPQEECGCTLDVDA
jgi:hypothetical protein